MQLTLPQMAKTLMLLPVADKGRPFPGRYNPFDLVTEGARPNAGGGWTHPDYPGATMDLSVMTPRWARAPSDFSSDSRLQSYLKATAPKADAEAAARATKFDSRISHLEKDENGYFVTLKDGYELPHGQGGSFGADSLKEIRETLRGVTKRK